MTAIQLLSRRRPGRPRDEALKERRRAEILEAATELFAETGFAAADIQVLADRIGVGKGTVYRYFPSKEELFLGTVDHGMRRLKEVIDSAAAKARTDLGRVEAGIRAYLKFFDDNPQVIELLIQERAHFRDRARPTYFVHRDANIGEWIALFQRLIDRGEIRDTAPEKLTDVISNLLYGTIFTNYFAGRKKPLLRQCADILDVVYNGLLKRSAKRNG